MYLAAATLYAQRSKSADTPSMSWLRRRSIAMSAGPGSPSRSSSASDSADEVRAGHREAPQAVQEARRPFERDGLPVDVVLRRLDRQMRQAERVRPEGVDDLLGRDEVAPRLGHLGAVESDHALGEEPTEGFAQIGRRDPQIRERLGEEPGVHEVQHRMFGTADVLVDGHPRLDRCPRERHVLAPWVTEAQEVPRAVDERVHRVGLAPCRAATARTLGVQEAVVGQQRRLPGGGELDVVGGEHR